MSPQDSIPEGLSDISSKVELEFQAITATYLEGNVILAATMNV